LIIGINDTGKTTLLHRLMNDNVEVPTPTWGFTTETVKVNKKEITLYDVGGSPTIRGIWNNYYAEIYGIIFVVDVSNEENINQSKELLPEVLKDQRLKGKPILIIANKVDKIESFEYMEVYNKLNIEQHVLDGITTIDKILIYPCTCLLVKGKRDSRIDSCIEWLIQKVKENKDYLKKKIQEDVQVQQEQYKLEQEEKKKRVEEYRKLRELQDKQKQQEQQFISNTIYNADDIQDNINSEQIELLTKEDKGRSKSRSNKSVKIYPEEAITSD
jgi:ADP-ribosylation factor-like protein 13B